MSNILDRRLRKLEATAKTTNGEGRPRLVLVRVGQSAEAEIAKLEDRRPDDHLMVVRFVRAADIQSPEPLQ